MIETKRIREKILIIHKDFNWIMIDMIHMTFEMFSLNNACAVNPKAFIIINEWKVADVWVIVRSIDSYEVYHVKSDKSAESQHAAVWPTQEGPGNQAHLSYKGNSTKKNIKHW